MSAITDLTNLLTTLKTTNDTLISTFNARIADLEKQIFDLNQQILNEGDDPILLQAIANLTIEIARLNALIATIQPDTSFISIPDTHAIPGGSFVVPIAITNTGAIVDIISFQFNLSYDSSMLKVNSVEQSPTLNGWILDSNPTPGKIIVGAFTGTPNLVLGKTNIALVHFTVISTVSTNATSDMTLDSVMFNATNLTPAQIKSGKFIAN